METALTCLLVVGVLLGEGPRWVAGDSLRCYTCVSIGEDLTCLNDPDSVTSSVPITNCKKDGTVCCTITRINYNEDDSKLQSFSRGCIDKCKEDGFYTTVDATYTSYETYCSTPECNVGPGDKALTGESGDAKDNEIWGIKGISGSGAPLTVSLTLLTTLAALLLLRQK